MLNQEIINKIRDLYSNGNPISEIQRQTGISRTTISKYTKDITEIKDKMVGLTFGKLTVLKRYEKDRVLKSRCLRYLCKCECGNEVVVNGNSLRTGHTTSCGCARKGINQVDLTGKKSGEITFLRPLEERTNYNHVIWEGICSCGRIVKLSSHEFGHTKSCGCLKSSFGEQLITSILTQQNIEFETQFKFEDCRNSRCLPFDFAIFNNGKLICLIEYQGQQHFMVTGGWNTKEHLESVQTRDAIKKDYCKNNNIPLIEIPYTDYDKIDWEYLKGKIENGLSVNS